MHDFENNHEDSHWPLWDSQLRKIVQIKQEQSFHSVNIFYEKILIYFGFLHRNIEKSLRFHGINL